MGVAAFSPEPGRPPSMAAMWSPSGAVLSAISGQWPPAAFGYEDLSPAKRAVL